MPVTQIEPNFPPSPDVDRGSVAHDSQYIHSISTRFNSTPNKRAFHLGERTMAQVGTSSKHLILLVASLAIFPGCAQTQESTAVLPQSVHSVSGRMDDTNAANNPLESLLTIDLQNRFVSSPAGFSGEIENQGLFRVAVPFHVLGVHNFVRTILPIDTTPIPQHGPNTGVGDLTVYDILPFQMKKVTLGGGPLIAAPTARGDAYDSGKWQAGAAAGVIAPQKWGLLAGLVTYQHSFSGNSSSTAGGLTTAQPFFFFHFSHGYYFRSSGVWSFDTFRHSQAIPIGFGLGKVIKRRNGDLWNFYVEPQYSAYQKGTGSATWQLFAGFTSKSPIRKREE